MWSSGAIKLPCCPLVDLIVVDKDTSADCKCWPYQANHLITGPKQSLLWAIIAHELNSWWWFDTSAFWISMYYCVGIKCNGDSKSIMDRGGLRFGVLDSVTWSQIGARRVPSMVEQPIQTLIRGQHLTLEIQFLQFTNKWQVKEEQKHVQCFYVWCLDTFLVEVRISHFVIIICGTLHLKSGNEDNEMSSPANKVLINVVIIKEKKLLFFFLGGGGGGVQNLEYNWTPFLSYLSE